MNTQAIASHLNIVDSAIIEIQEWASVLWVRFIGGVRFVSKKIGEIKMTVDFTVESQLCNGNWVERKLSSFVDAIIERESWIAPRQKRTPMTTQAEIIKFLESGETINWDSDWYAVIRAPKAPRRVREYTEPMMRTSIGELVSADEWDDIEGAM